MHNGNLSMTETDYSYLRQAAQDELRTRQNHAYNKRRQWCYATAEGRLAQAGFEYAKQKAVYADRDLIEVARDAPFPAFHEWLIEKGAVFLCMSQISLMFPGVTADEHTLRETMDAVRNNLSAYDLPALILADTEEGDTVITCAPL